MTDPSDPSDRDGAPSDPGASGASGASGARETTPPRLRLATFAGPAADLGVPLVGYYALRAVGTTEWVALLGATLAAGVRLIWVAVRARRVTGFAAVMVAVFGLGLGLAFVGGDARFLLLKDSFGTTAVGVVFLASLAAGRPLTLSAFQTWNPDEAEKMGELYRTEPAARRVFRVTAIVWGLGLLVEAGLRVPMIYLIPLDVAVGVSTAMMAVAIVALSIWTAAYVARARTRAEAGEGS
jgi:hypothetical protein